MPANADLVKMAVDAVKKMQELEVGQRYYDNVLHFVKTPTNSSLPQTLQNATNKTTILKKQIEELIAFYKKIDTSIFVGLPEFWLVEIFGLAVRHQSLLTQPNFSHDSNVDYDEITKPIRNSHHDFFQVISLIGAMEMLGGDYGKFKDAEQILNRKIEKLDALEDSMPKKIESWSMDILKLKEEIAELKKEAGEVLELAKETLESAKETLESAKETLESAKEVSTNEAITALAVFFKEQGEEHKTKQKYWLWTSIGVTAILLGCLMLFYMYSPDTWGTKIILQTAIKAFGFSLLLSVLIFCIKNYKAHGHNYIVNIHRVNSLKTYKAIVDGANSPDARDIIMANIAQHIFMPIDTGYVKGADSVGNPTMEIIRSGVKLVDGKE